MPRNKYFYVTPSKINIYLQPLFLSRGGRADQGGGHPKSHTRDPLPQKGARVQIPAPAPFYLSYTQESSNNKIGATTPEMKTIRKIARLDDWFPRTFNIEAEGPRPGFEPGTTGSTGRRASKGYTTEAYNQK